MAREAALTELVWTRAKRRCEYCQMPQAFDPLPFEIDHIISVQHGGLTTAGNLALSCFACNRRKGPNLAGFDRILQTTVPLFHPRNDDWCRHFRWFGATLEGETVVGRVTIHVLGINQDYRVALRNALFLEGVFPPGDSSDE